MRHPMHFWRGCTTTFVLSVAGGSAIIVAAAGSSVDPLALACAYLVGAGWAYGMQFLLSKMYFIEVSEKGIAGCTFWGKPGFLGWNAIAAARRYYLPPMGFIYVRAVDQSPALWLPTHVDRQSELIAEVERHAPVLHPLLRAYAP